MDIAAALNRIRAAAMAKPASQRAGYITDNIKHQQAQARRFAEMRNPPAGWSVAKSEDLIRGLIELEREFVGRIAA